MVANCTKFEANIFDKGKCKNCYKPKEQHSADVLEQAKVGSVDSSSDGHKSLFLSGWTPESFILTASESRLVL